MEKFKKLAEIKVLNDLVTSIRHRGEKFLPCSTMSKNQMNFERMFFKYFSNFYVARAELYIVIVEVFKEVQKLENNKIEISSIKKQLEAILNKFSFKDYQKLSKKSDNEEARIKECLELISINSKSTTLNNILGSNLQFYSCINLRENAIKMLISNALEENIFVEIKQLLKVLKNEELFSKLEILEDFNPGLITVNGDIELIVLVMQELESFLKHIAQKNRKHIKGYIYSELMNKFKIMYKYQELYVDTSYLNDTFILIYKLVNEIYVSIKNNKF